MNRRIAGPWSVFASRAGFFRAAALAAAWGMTSFRGGAAEGEPGPAFAPGIPAPAATTAGRAATETGTPGDAGPDARARLPDWSATPEADSASREAPGRFAFAADVPGLDGWWPEVFAGRPFVERREVGEAVAVAGTVVRQPLPPERTGLDEPPVAVDPPRPFSPDDAVATGERIATGADGYWEALVGPNVRLRLGPDSEVEIRRADTVAGHPAPRRVELRLVAGTVRVRVARNALRPDAVVVFTDALDAVAVRGDLLVALGGGADAAAVLAGSAFVRPTGRDKKGRAPAAALAAGEGLSVVGGRVGLGRLAPAQERAWRSGLSFTPDRRRAALPPAPPPGIDAPGL